MADTHTQHTHTIDTHHIQDPMTHTGGAGGGVSPLAAVASQKLGVLRGTLDDGNPLAKLRGNGLVWSRVFEDINRLVEHIDARPVAHHVVQPPWRDLQFPAPADIIVNMMPIKLFQLRETLPEHLHQYIPLIRACPTGLGKLCPFEAVEAGMDVSHDKVAYLTVHESLVPVGEPQLQAGLHVERPGLQVSGI